MDNRPIELFGSFFEPVKDHIALGQLGAAVVMLWAELPEPLRLRLLSLPLVSSEGGNLPSCRRKREALCEETERNERREHHEEQRADDEAARGHNDEEGNVGIGRLGLVLGRHTSRTHRADALKHHSEHAQQDEADQRHVEGAPRGRLGLVDDLVQSTPQPARRRTRLGHTRVTTHSLPPVPVRLCSRAIL